MAELTFQPHYKYIIELSCYQNNSTDVSKITPALLFDSALISIPKYSNPQKYGVPYQYLAANVPSGMIGQYGIVAQQYIIDTHLEKNQMEEICKRISAKHCNCTIKIVQSLM